MSHKQKNRATRHLGDRGRNQETGAAGNIPPDRPTRRLATEEYPRIRRELGHGDESSNFRTQPSFETIWMMRPSASTPRPLNSERWIGRP
jgi:hypothetical protein